MRAERAMVVSYTQADILAFNDWLNRPAKRPVSLCCALGDVHDLVTLRPGGSDPTAANLV